MNYILLYSLSLLLYQTLSTAEEHRLRYYLGQIAKTGRLQLDFAGIQHHPNQLYHPRHHEIAV